MLAGGLEHAEPGGVGVLEDDVGAAADLGERLLLAGADVVPVADVAGDDADLRVDALRAALEGFEAALDGRQLGAAEDADDVALRQSAGLHAGEVGGLLEAEVDAAEVGLG